MATPGSGRVTVTGIVEEEEMGQDGHRMRRKSTARGSADNVKTLLVEMGYPLEKHDLHINFPGGAPVDGPSAGAAMAVVAISALTGRRIDGSAAVTGEISVQGKIKAVGGVPAKVEAAKQAGLTRVFVPAENGVEIQHCEGVEICCVSELKELLEQLLLSESQDAATPALPPEMPLVAQGTENTPVVCSHLN